MAEYDGYVRIKTDLDDVGLMKKLTSVATRINRQTASLEKAKQKAAELQRQYDELSKPRKDDAGAISAFNKRLRELRNRRGEIYADWAKEYEDQERLERMHEIDPKNGAIQLALEEQRRKVEALARQYETAGKAVKDWVAEWDKIKESPLNPEDAEKVAKNLEAARSEVERLTIDLENNKRVYEALNKPTEELPENLRRAGEQSSDLSKKLSKIAKIAGGLYVFRRLLSYFRNSIMSITGLSAVAEVFSSFNQKMTETYKKNTQFQKALSNLRGALLSAFGPISQTIIPALVTLVNWLAKAISAIAAFISALSGQSMTASAKGAAKLSDEISNVGDSTRDANKQLATFDKLNTLTENKGGGGGGGGWENATMPEIGPLPAWVQTIADKLREILPIIKTIALAIAGISLARHIGEVLDWGDAFNKVMGKLISFGIAVLGVVVLWKGFEDAINNGVNWGNLILMLAGSLLLFSGLNKALGPIAGKIGLAAGGILLFTAGLKDWIDNGEATNEALTSMSIGIGEIGIALAGVTGGWSLLVAAIAVGILWIIGKWDYLKEWASGFFTAENFPVFTAQYWKDLWDGIKFQWETSTDDLKEKWTGLKDSIRDTVLPIKEKFVSAWTSLRTWWDSKAAPVLTLSYWQDKISSVLGFDIDLKGKIEGAWSSLQTWWDNNVAEVFTAEYWSGKINAIGDAIAGAFSAMWDSIKQGVIDIVNTCIDYLNALLARFDAVLSFFGASPIRISHIGGGGFQGGGGRSGGGFGSRGNSGNGLGGGPGSVNTEVYSMKALSSSATNEAQLVQAFRTATTEQVDLLRQQNALLSALLEKSGTVTFSPSASAGRVFQQSINLYARGTGG